MIHGSVNEQDEPLGPITLIVKKRSKHLQAVLDTGFNGYLSVPQSVADTSDWYFAGYEEYEIATGDLVQERVYIGDVVFEGERHMVPVVTSYAEDVLIGTKLLQGKELHIDFKKQTLWVKKAV